MNTKREANLLLMAHWTQAWTTLGRWPALNARLSKESAAPSSGWAKRSGENLRWRAARAAVSASTR